jgi:multimeric flavodoxin WrbA
MKVLGISASPRENSNSDMLLRRALAGASSADAEAEYLRLAKLNIAPCTACGVCYASGSCIIQDDYQMLLSKMLEAQRLIFATPVYFMTVCAQAKILIDRCQCLWARKYLLKRPIRQQDEKRWLGMVIAVGGTKSQKMFDGVRLTMKYYFDALYMDHLSSLFVSGVDEAGKIADNAGAMEQAFQLGAALARASGPAEKPTEAEIIG